MNKISDGALAAMKRASLVARQRASEKGLKIVIWRDGKVVEIDPRTKPPQDVGGNGDSSGLRTAP